MLSCGKFSDRKRLCIPGGKSGFNFTGVSGPGAEDIFTWEQTLLKHLSVGPIKGCENSVIGICCRFIHGREANGSVVRDASKATQSLWLE